MQRNGKHVRRYQSYLRLGEESGYPRKMVSGEKAGPTPWTCRGAKSFES